MSECNIELSLKTKIKKSSGKFFLKLLFIFLMIFFLIGFILFFEFSYLVFSVIFAVLAFKKYKEENYKVQANVSVLDNNNVEFVINNFCEDSGRTYDLRIVFPMNRIEYMYIDDNPYERELVGGNISGFPILYKQIAQISESIDSSINKEEVNIIYEFNNNRELIDKLEEIRKSVLK